MTNSDSCAGKELVESHLKVFQKEKNDQQKITDGAMKILRDLCGEINKTFCCVKIPVICRRKVFFCDQYREEKRIITAVYDKDPCSVFVSGDGDGDDVVECFNKNFIIKYNQQGTSILCEYDKSYNDSTNSEIIALLAKDIAEYISAKNYGEYR